MMAEPRNPRGQVVPPPCDGPQNTQEPSKFFPNPSSAVPIPDTRSGHDLGAGNKSSDRYASTHRAGTAGEVPISNGCRTPPPPCSTRRVRSTHPRHPTRHSVSRWGLVPILAERTPHGTEAAQVQRPLSQTTTVGELLKKERPPGRRGHPSQQIQKGNRSSASFVRVSPLQYLACSKNKSSALCYADDGLRELHNVVSPFQLLSFKHLNFK